MARERGGVCLNLGHHKGEKEHRPKEKREGVFHQKSNDAVLQKKSSLGGSLKGNYRELGHLQSPSDSDLRETIGRPQSIKR